MTVLRVLPIELDGCHVSLNWRGLERSILMLWLRVGRRRNVLSRLRARLRFRLSLRRCGDFLLEDPPPGSFVREPLRPRPLAPGGAIALELPEFDS